MSPDGILLLAVGLATDATTVAAARGLAATRLGPREVGLTALFFGGAQALMPLAGALAGARLGDALAPWLRGAASLLLLGLGVSMLRASRRDERASGADASDADANTHDLFALRPLAALALATSLDALAVGVTLPALGAPLALTVSTIGLVTALLSALGLFLGRRFGALVGRRLDALGGLVLVALALRLAVALV